MSETEIRDVSAWIKPRKKHGPEREEEASLNLRITATLTHLPSLGYVKKYKNQNAFLATNLRYN